MKHYIILIITLGFYNFSFNQERKMTAWENTTKEEFMSASEKASLWFTKNTNYKVDITYSSYMNHSSLSPHDFFSGYYKRQNNNFCSSAMGVLMIQNEKIKISVDTINKFILLQNKTAVNQSPTDTKGISELLDRVKSIKKQKGAKGEMSYRIEFNPNELYSAYEYRVNEKGLLLSIIYYYSKELKQEKEESTLTGKPRLEIGFSNYQTNINFNYEKEFSEKVYLKEDGKKMTPTDRYKKFELKDYRFPVK